MVGSGQQIREIDISKHVNAIKYISILNFILLIFAPWYIIRLLRSVWLEPGHWSDTAIGTFFLATAISIGVYVAWRYIRTLNTNAHIWFLPFLCFLAVVLFLRDIIVVLILILGDVDALREITAEQDFTWATLHPTSFGLIVLYDLLVMGLVCVLSFAAFICALRLRNRRIPQINMSLRDMLSNLRRSIDVKAHISRDAKKINMPIGVTLSIIGVVIVLIPMALPLVYRRLMSAEMGLMSVLTPCGMSLVVRARRYLQFDADSLLSGDKRKPILFLRSFDDDEKPQYARAEASFYDFSLKTRLAEHFKYFGPFLAIGSPSESVPLPGAARVKLSDSEWQDRVVGWIGNAILIIMYAGKTHWVNWELARIIETGRAQNLILMMPEFGKRRRLWWQDLGLRIDRMRDVFKKHRME